MFPGIPDPPLPTVERFRPSYTVVTGHPGVIPSIAAEQAAREPVAILGQSRRRNDELVAGIDPKFNPGRPGPTRAVSEFSNPVSAQTRYQVVQGRESGKRERALQIRDRSRVENLSLFRKDGRDHDPRDAVALGVPDLSLDGLRVGKPHLVLELLTRHFG